MVGPLLVSLDRDYVSILGGSHEGAIVLTRAVIIQRENLDARGRPKWWPLSGAEWLDLTGLTRGGLRHARRRLLGYHWFGIAERDGQTWYRVDLTALAARVARMYERKAQAEMAVCAE